MRDWRINMPSKDEDSIPESSRGGRIQPSLFPIRIGTIYPSNPIGKDHAFMCEAVGGGTYYCKEDKDGKPARAADFIGTSLASHLGIAVPEYCIMEDANGDTYFGSRQSLSTADPFHLQAFLTSPKTNELGQRVDWLGRHLAMVYVLDLFVSNVDRNNRNFVLERDGLLPRLCTIDYADAQLGDLSTGRFPVAATSTIRHGRFIRNVHGFFADSALEMVERIRVVPNEFLVGILGGMPDDWLADDQKRMLCDFWASGARESRLSALHTGIVDGSLL